MDRSRSVCQSERGLLWWSYVQLLHQHPFLPYKYQMPSKNSKLNSRSANLWVLGNSMNTHWHLLLIIKQHIKIQAAARLEQAELYEANSKSQVQVSHPFCNRFLHVLEDPL